MDRTTEIAINAMQASIDGKDQRIAELQAALSEKEATAASYKQQVEALTKEVAGLKGRFDKDQERIKTQAEYLASAQDKIERLSQENMLLKVDAERAQCLRQAGVDQGEWTVESFNSAIDAATKKFSPRLICPRCKVDRFKSPCPDNSYNCPIKGEAQ